MTAILIAGQSNALGYGNVGPVEYIPTERVQIWVDTNGDRLGDSFQTMRPGVNTGTSSNPNVWGPEVEIANRWLADNPEGVLFIGKETQGSTGLAFDPVNLDWSTRSIGELFDRTTASVRAMREYLGTDIDVVFWSQGETDAYDQAKTDSYGANLSDLFSRIRSDWMGDRDGEIVFSRVHDGVPNFEQVRWAQYLVDLSDEHAVSFDTFDFGMQADNLHFSGEGHVQMGEHFYDGWMI